MRIKLFFSTLMLLYLNYSVVNSQTCRVWVIPEETKKCGYVDKNGEIVIEPIYSRCYEFTNDGTALVAGKSKTVYLLIDTMGNEIKPEVKLNLDKASITGIVSVFHDGILKVSQSEKWGAINSKGKLTTPIVYDELSEFSEGYAIGIRDKLYYVVDSMRNAQLIVVYKIEHVWHFSEGLATIEVQGEKYGFINTSGKIVIEPQFKKAGYFVGGYAWARTEDDLIGFISKTGEWIIKPKFAAVRDFDKESGMAMARVDDNWGYVDTLGNFHTITSSENIYNYSDGLAVSKKDYKVGYINNKGEWVIEPQYEVAYKFINGHARVKKDGKWGLIDKNGNWILKPVYNGTGEMVTMQ